MRSIRGCATVPENLPLLSVRGLRVSFGRGDDAVIAVDGVDLDVHRAEVVAIVGESGSGKSVSMLAALGLIDPPGYTECERMDFDGIDLHRLSPAARRQRVGRRVSMIFQDPVASLDPCWSIGAQLIEVLAAQHGGPRPALRERAIDLLRQVDIPDPQARLSAWPHQVSGGMCQRVMIAMALAGEPELLIADEPTTALDVTLQAQVMALLRRLQRERGMAMVFVSHDLALVSGVADRVHVMYAGRVMESGSPDAVFGAPSHPYTRALIDALPQANRGRRRLNALPGTVTVLSRQHRGCSLAPRCPQASAQCRQEQPMPRVARSGAIVSCHHADPQGDQ